MSWGLLLGLIGFLLPLSVALRVLINLVHAQLPLARPLQAYRLTVLAMTAIPITGKAPAFIYSLDGDFGQIGNFTAGFMLTGWGAAHLGATIVSVLLFDIFAPRIERQLAAEGEWLATRAYLPRDLGVVVLCVLLAWAAAL